MSSEPVDPRAQRFVEERKRLGFDSAGAVGRALGFSQQALSKVESGTSVPGGDLLAAFATNGGDIGYVLTGQRSGTIDQNLFGLVERALVYAFIQRRGANGAERIRGRAISQAYNMAIGRLQPGVDLVDLANEVARHYVESFDDPLEPDLLERNLLRTVEGASAPASGTAIHASGSGHRIAGGSYTESRKRPKTPKA